MNAETKMTERQEKLLQVIIDAMEKASPVEAHMWKENPAATVGDELELDSLDRIEVAIDIEKEMNIVIPDDQIETWRNKTIKEVYESLKDLV